MRQREVAGFVEAVRTVVPLGKEKHENPGVFHVQEMSIEQMQSVVNRLDAATPGYVWRAVERYHSPYSTDGTGMVGPFLQASRPNGRYVEAMFSPVWKDEWAFIVYAGR